MSHEISTTQTSAQTSERKAILAVDGEAGGKGIMIVPEAMILDGVKQLKKLIDGPVKIQELEVPRENR